MINPSKFQKILLCCCVEIHNMWVYHLGDESSFSKVRKTSIFEHFTVEPELVQSTWNFVDTLLVCMCRQEIFI